MKVVGDSFLLVRRDIHDPDVPEIVPPSEIEILFVDGQVAPTISKTSRLLGESCRAALVAVFQTQGPKVVITAAREVNVLPVL